jgi:hypothetical protein
LLLSVERHRGLVVILNVQDLGLLRAIRSVPMVFVSFCEVAAAGMTLLEDALSLVASAAAFRPLAVSQLCTVITEGGALVVDLFVCVARDTGVPVAVVFRQAAAKVTEETLSAAV